MTQEGKDLSKCVQFHGNAHIFMEMCVFSCIFTENAKNKVSQIGQCKALCKAL